MHGAKRNAGTRAPQREAARIPLRSHPGYACWTEDTMANEKGPNIKKMQKCKNCEGKGTLKKGNKVVKCQRCGGSGVR